ncbi:MAG: hypothetical protein JO225_03015 [Candidatus Eremiobacteraeota bacterium]|nr:hypothetical protein [Candidatus Eremiobacteraeota bacterium]MBV8642867.1 hypothetical protein [Candidatus Eremiobacteraeota bacterium]
MRYVLVVATITLMCGACALVTSSRAGAQIVDPRMSPTPDPALRRDADVAAIYDLWRHHDVDTLRARYAAALAALPSASPTPTPAPSPSSSPAERPKPVIRIAPTPPPTIDPALVLALYALDRTTYRDAFVANYPADEDGVGNDYGMRLDRARVVPQGSGFPVAALAGYAPDDDAARRALFVAAASAPPSLHGAYARALAHVAAARPEATLRTIAALDSPERLAIIADDAWCAKRPALLGVQTSDPQESVVRDRIGDTVSRCPPPAHLRAKTKRVKHPAKHAAAPHAR